MSKVVFKPAVLAFVFLMWVNAGVAAPAEPDVLVLPFAVNADPDTAQSMAGDFPALLRSSQGDQGFRVRSAADTARVAGTTVTQDPDRVRAFARAAGAAYAVYGTFSQLGEAFSIDLRLVDAQRMTVRPYYTEGSNFL